MKISFDFWFDLGLTACGVALILWYRMARGLWPWDSEPEEPPEPFMCPAMHTSDHMPKGIQIGCELRAGHQGHHRARYTLIWPNDQDIPQPNYTPGPTPPGSIEYDHKPPPKAPRLPREDLLYKRGDPEFRS